MKDALKISNCDAEAVEARTAKIFLHAISWTKANVTGSTMGAAKEFFLCIGRMEWTD
jgi:hypothetical protein